jgi:hypothetical protein
MTRPRITAALLIAAAIAWAAGAPDTIDVIASARWR